MPLSLIKIFQLTERVEIELIYSFSYLIMHFGKKKNPDSRRDILMAFIVLL